MIGATGGCRRATPLSVKTPGVSRLRFYRFVRASGVTRVSLETTGADGNGTGLKFP
jgi:hypothetical protein